MAAPKKNVFRFHDPNPPAAAAALLRLLAEANCGRVEAAMGEAARSGPAAPVPEEEPGKP